MAKDGKEGLLERSRKILGFNNRGETPKASGNQDTTSDSTSESKARYQRRRDQVRRAQRSHRERKENYIKALEQEILELRTNPSSRVKALQAQIAYLKGFLDTNGIALPENWMQEASRVFSAKPNAVAWFSQSNGSNTEIRIATPDQTPKDTFRERHSLATPLEPNLRGTNYALAEPAAAFIPYNPALAEPEYPTNTEMGQDPASIPLPPVLPTDENIATTVETNQALATAEASKAEILAAGIEFILLLERGCMSHYHMVVPTPTGDPGHAFLASHHLLALAPQGVAPGSNWQVPEATIDNLLSLSTQFDLGGEITPVQAWHKLKQHPRFGKLTPSHIHKLADELKFEAQCHGFGAVLETTIFDAAVQNFFTRI